MIANAIGPRSAAYFGPASEVYLKMRPNPLGITHVWRIVISGVITLMPPVRFVISNLRCMGWWIRHQIRRIILGASHVFSTCTVNFISSVDSGRPVVFRLPFSYGYEESTVHTVELAAMIASMRWISPGAYNMFVGDRSALFSALKEAADPCSLWPTKGACLPLEGRLRAILRRIASAWTGESGFLDLER